MLVVVALFEFGVHKHNGVDLMFWFYYSLASHIHCLPACLIDIEESSHIVAGRVFLFPFARVRSRAFICLQPPSVQFRFHCRQPLHAHWALALAAVVVD